MAVVNNFVPANKPPIVLPNPDEPYDLNFRYPVRELETDKLKLVPFVVRTGQLHSGNLQDSFTYHISQPSIYGQPLFEAIQRNPELLLYLPWHPFKTAHEFELHYEGRIRSDPAWCVFAILDKSKLTDETDPSHCKRQTQSCVFHIASFARLAALS